MNKKILLLIFAVLAVPVLSGCSPAICYQTGVMLSDLPAVCRPKPAYVPPKPVTAKRLTYIAKTRMSKAIKYIESYNGNVSLPASQSKHFGYNNLQLRQIAFNITDTQYYSQINSAAAGVCGTHGNSNEIVSASGTVGSNITAFIDQTNNEQALYSIVNAYYAKALTARFGSLKTSFLKNAGIPANLDISYDTILRRANRFLDYIVRNSQNADRFNIVFGVNFLKWQKNKNDICEVSRFAPYVKKLEYYYTPNTNTVNFFSLTYYLLNNIYSSSGGNRRFSKMLFAYITLGSYQKAYNLFHTIYAPALTKTFNFYSIQNFLSIARQGYSKENLKELKKIANYYGQYPFFVPLMFLGNPKYKGGLEKDKLYYNLKRIIAAIQAFHDISLKKKSNYMSDRYRFTRISNRSAYASEWDFDNSGYYFCLQQNQWLNRQTGGAASLPGGDGLGTGGSVRFCRHRMPTYP